MWHIALVSVVLPFITPSVMSSVTESMPALLIDITPSRQEGRLFLSSQAESHDNIYPELLNLSRAGEEEAHDFRPPRPSDFRSPCPALNALANHGYLPRDGKNIPISSYITALEHPATYRLSSELAHVLAKGGAILTEDSPFALPISLFDDNLRVSLHHLSVHNGVEHDASIVHKNTPRNHKYAPTQTDYALLDGFLGDRTTIELADIARRRVALERVSPIDAPHAEIARGEWSLVLGIFGRAHDGKIPAGVLREWLGENRFPHGWRPDHEQTLRETIRVSSEIRHAMRRIGKNATAGEEGGASDDDELLRMLT